VAAVAVALMSGRVESVSVENGESKQAREVETSLSE